MCICLNFDNLQVTHERGRLIEENHYYAYGLKIAGISSRKLNDPREGHLKNFYQYQGEYSEWDEDLGWTDFFLRSYDAQIGRFWQMDPYDQFSSPFTGMGNDPVNFVDPSGGSVLSIAGDVLKQVACPGSGAGFLSVIKDAVKGASGFIALGTVWFSARQFFVNSKVSEWRNDDIENQLGSNTQINNSEGEDEDWKPFYKSDLITYTQSKGISPTENNLGEQFENIFEETLTSSFPVQTKTMKFRRAGKVWTEGTGRNSKPDFVSDDFYDQMDDCWFCPAKIKPVIEGSGYEIKQNNGRGIYLSSNNAQIKGHIDNLSAKHAADIATGSYNPSLTLITTYDVSWSPSITRYAGIRKVQYTHRRAMYKIVNGKYQFKFVGFGLSRL